MISASFMFNQREYDDEYFALDGRIAEIAKATQGYIGEEAWQNLENGKGCTVYYWEGREAPARTRSPPQHRRRAPPAGPRGGGGGRPPPFSPLVSRHRSSVGLRW